MRDDSLGKLFRVDSDYIYRLQARIRCIDINYYISFDSQNTHEQRRGPRMAMNAREMYRVKLAR